MAHGLGKARSGPAGVLPLTSRVPVLRRRSGCASQLRFLASLQEAWPHCSRVLSRCGDARWAVGGGRGVTAAPLQGRWLSGLLLFTLLCSGSTLPVECRANGHFLHPLFNCEPSISGFYLKFVVERALDVELGDLSLLRGWLFSMFDLQDDIFHGKGLADR